MPSPIPRAQGVSAELSLCSGNSRRRVWLTNVERERLLLKPLAERPYAGVVPAPSAPAEEVLPRVVVEHRSLAAYGLLGEVRR